MLATDYLISKFERRESAYNLRDYDNILNILLTRTVFSWRIFAVLNKDFFFIYVPIFVPAVLFSYFKIK